MKTIFSAKGWWVIVVLVVIVVGGWWGKGIWVAGQGESDQGIIQDERRVDFDESAYEAETWAALDQGCPVKDCIPAIDEPRFESAAEANRWLESDDVVFGLDYQGVQRAYPQRILNWHEIVNDQVKSDKSDNVAGEDVYFAVTFCPLCGSAIAFEREVEGRVLDFGVSGKLKSSNLVMYDRQTLSLWQQITGEAIGGEFLGSKLVPVAMETLRWREWRETHPAAEVLSRETGYLRDYSTYPYGTYEQDRSVYFPVEGEVDETIHPKTVVYGVVINDEARAYTQAALERETADDGVLTDTLGGARLRLSYSKGEVVVENLGTKTEVVPARMFWFAWKAFYAESTLYQ